MTLADAEAMADAMGWRDNAAPPGYATQRVDQKRGYPVEARVRIVI